MAQRVDLSSFPKLKLDSNDVSGSWDSWLTQFEIAVELTTLNLGKEAVEAQQVDKFRGRSKLLALLGAIGAEGSAILKSQGFDVKNNTVEGYKSALDLLKGHYEREESFYVKTMKFVTVSQTCGEDERDYLLRVQTLSRDMGFGEASEDVRNRFAVALAVNGLRENSMRRQLLQENDLTWDQLSTKLRARHIGRESEQMLSETRVGHFSVKKEARSEVDLVESSDSGVKGAGKSVSEV